MDELEKKSIWTQSSSIDFPKTLKILDFGVWIQDEETKKCFTIPIDKFLSIYEKVKQ